MSTDRTTPGAAARDTRADVIGGVQWMRSIAEERERHARQGADDASEHDATASPQALPGAVEVTHPTGGEPS